MLRITENFGKPLKSLFSDKSKSRNTITLIENKNIEMNNIKIADILNMYVYGYPTVPAKKCQP